MARLVACFALVLVVIVPSFADDDSILADLKKAKAAHAKELARLREKLLTDIDRVIKAENDRGAGINYLQKEKKGFEESRILPVLPKLLPASREYVDGKKAADAALEKAYATAVTALTKSGRVDEVKVLKDELKELQGKGSELAADTVPAELVGTWVVTFTNQITRTYVIQSDGNISCAEDGKLRRSRLRSFGKSFLMEFGDGTLDRLTLVVDGRLMDEHYRTKADIATDKPTVMGVGKLNKR